MVSRVTSGDLSKEGSCHTPFLDFALPICFNSILQRATSVSNGKMPMKTETGSLHVHSRIFAAIALMSSFSIKMCI